MASVVATEKPHVVMLPFPSQGHINPMLKLAKIFHNKGFHVTFVNTHYNHSRLVKSRGHESLNAIPTFQYHSISDGLPPSSDSDASQIIPVLANSLEKVGLVNFRELLTKLNAVSSTKHYPVVTCVVIDFSCAFCLPVAKELGIPSIAFSPFNVCSMIALFHTPGVLERGLFPSKDDEGSLTDEYMDSRIDWIEGLKDMRVRDLPTFITMGHDPNTLPKYVKLILDGPVKPSAVIINTFDALESKTLETMTMKHRSMPPFYTLGPLHLLEKQMCSNELIKSLGANLWKEEASCITWLDTQEPNSVLFVSFGSTSFLTSDQLKELAWGLASSKKPFLWIIRPDLVSGGDSYSSILPPEFYSETKERSLLVSWCPQEQVLNHSSTGGFLTHSGWNSTLESISAGLPMICCPSIADQPTTCRYTCAHWGIGIELDLGHVKRDIVEKVVKELLEMKKGKEMKKKGLEWKKKAQDATSPGGSSFINFNKVVDQVLVSG